MHKPISIVVFGVTGDLFKKKLVHAFFDLYKRGELGNDFVLYGYSRKDWSDEEFRKYVQEHLNTKEVDVAEEFVGHLFFRSGDILNKDTYDSLKTDFGERDELLSECTNKLFYLAVTPELYEDVFINLSHSGLTVPCAPGTPGQDGAWIKLIVEKPFGRDELHAKMLDDLLGKLFLEEQIFRIDHYLAKETLQNILAFRFGNTLFESLWSRRHIEKIEICSYEENDLNGRGAFYEDVGALNDVGQNHLLQMLALVAMENPASFSSSDIRRSRADVLASVNVSHDQDGFKRGQYKGYTDEPGVEDTTETETYFKATLKIDNERWKEVPFVLSHGKALPKTKAEIVVTFKNGNNNDSNLFIKSANVLTFHIQPKEGIAIDFFAKKSGYNFELEKKTLAFEYKSTHKTPFVYPYEKLLKDAISGDQTLFIGTEEIASQWRVVSEVKKVFDNIPLLIYDKGQTPEELLSETLEE